MRKSQGILVIFAVFLAFFYCYSIAQADQKEQLIHNSGDRMAVCREYLETNPPKHQLVYITHLIEEPYFSCIVSSFLQRDLDKQDLITLLQNKNMRLEHSEFIWKQVENELSILELDRIFMGSNEKNKLKAFDILLSRNLTKDDLLLLLHAVDSDSLEKHKPFMSKLFEIFLRLNPTREDWLSMASWGFYRDYATEELLKQPLTSNEILRLVAHLTDSTRRRGPELLARLYLPELSEEDLLMVSAFSIEPYADLARQILEAADYEGRKGRRNWLLQIMIDDSKQPHTLPNR